jgi:hypothetical protein
MARSIRNIVPANGKPQTKVDPTLGRELYFATDGMNASSITAGVDKGLFYPLHTKDAYEDESESVGDHFDFGTLGHMACFEPGRVKTDVAIWTGGRRAGKAWGEFCTNNNGKLIVKEQTYNETLEALMPLISLAEFREHTSAGSAEVALFGEFDGIQLRGQVDWISQSKGTHWDLKTSRDIRPEPFGRQFFSLHYDMKMAFYRELLRQNGLDLNSHNIAAIRNKKPWDAILYPIPEEVLDRGWAKMKEILSVIKDCHDADLWPGAGLGDAWGDLVIPYYAMAEEDQVSWGE